MSKSSETPLLVALTGSIGSGKSLISRGLEKQGVVVLDSDVLARDVVAPGSEALAEISKRFGPAILEADGSLSRKRLGDIVFSDSQARSDLEAIMHPRIRSKMLEKIDDNMRNGAAPLGIILAVIPLLFESRTKQPDFDLVVVVSASRELCISRVMQRDNCSREAAELRLNAQLPTAEKELRADVVLSNTRDISSLDQEISTLLRRLIRLRDAKRALVAVN